LDAPTAARLGVNRGLSTRGMRWAYAFGLTVALLLPKRVDCGVPDVRCDRRSALGLLCHAYELEPWGLYGLELVMHRDVGFAYSRGEECS
jgi:hypothetical protein